MRTVAEMIYIVESERQAFIDGAIHPDLETRQVLYHCGVRNQRYFALNEYIFMTFDYSGNTFQADMAKMAAYLDGKGLLVQTRRKDVPVERRKDMNWWAPVKKLADLSYQEDSVTAVHNPQSDDHIAQLDGGMKDTEKYLDISYDADEWIQSVQVW